MTFDIYTRASLDDSKKRFILLQFAKELIKNSGEYLYTLEKVVEDKERLIQREKDRQFAVVKKLESGKETESIENAEKNGLKEESKESGGGISDVVKRLEEEKFEISLKPLAAPRERFRPSLEKARLRIPEPALPPQFRYLKPTPSERQIDIGKLNPLVQDPLVKSIECGGPGQNIIVTESGGAKKTSIILSKEEIDEIVERFSNVSKIPIHEGVFRVVVGRLIFLAITSQIVGSRFIIRKMIAGGR
ncbi:hypothetical protein HY449_03500 [Candidatus Pacearchaeota archaeon]|nr:hypothetical protein [Candidatus Pacearchaeota archaeon]